MTRTTRRWSLIALIAALAAALTLVVLQITTGGTEQDGKGGGKGQASSGSPDPSSKLKGVGWWPAHDRGTDKAGENDATLHGGTSWGDGPNGGALQVNGTDGWADTGARVIDTENGDYSVAARVRLGEKKEKGFATAVSQDTGSASAFYLQYSAPDDRFAFSTQGKRAVAETADAPETGRWYHVVGTYSHADRKLTVYVDGKQVQSVQAAAPEGARGNLVIGRAKFRDAPSDFWNGGIADVHAYDRVLSADDVASLEAHEPN